MSDQLPTDEKLQQCLGPEWISHRAGHGGSKLMYLEGKTAINLANEIFGYDGWSSEIKDTAMDFFEVTKDGRFTLGISTTVRITLKNGTFHEDVGYGVSENSKTRATAFEKARKESATDGMKRALRIFGNAVGNCIYDKGYLRNVSNMSRPSIPFAPLELYRHPHVRKTIEEQMKRSTEKQPTTTASSASSTSHPSHPSHTPQNTIASTSTTKKQQPVESKPTTYQHVAPSPSLAPTLTPSLSAHKNDIFVDETTAAKRQFDDDLGPELFAEDSFMIDDEDDEFYAQVADCHSIPLSPPPSHTNHQSSANSDHAFKRQRQ